MASKTSPAPPSAIHPPLGTLIDGDSLELVEVLGVGGYGVVYRAVDARYPSGPKSYAVKCLVASGHQTARQRQIHIREIALHQLASAHPGVVTLHRVVEHFNHTYIIMDYAPDHDLFTQILHNCRYLGSDALIKNVFLQMLDAVEYCHSLGIYHRDLKPENILCYDDGLRVAITDFGLATTDKISEEFRTGSVYHMSPECQGGAFAPGGKYSPMFNDIWSLGIILLNLATGRNPWKSATADDPTFQAYLRDPYGFLPTVLPISPELNDILVQMLEVDYRQRMRISEVRRSIMELTTFYSDGVVFEGSMARCPWEAGMDIDSESSEENVRDVPSPQPSVSSPVQEEPRLSSRWSKDSLVFEGKSSIDDNAYGVPWPEYSSCGATWAFESPVSSNSSDEEPFPLERSETPSEASTESPTPSLPTTPNSFDMTFSAQQPKLDLLRPPFAGLTINTNLSKPRIFRANNSITESFSTESDMMHTAIEYDPYSSLFFLQTPISAKLIPESAITAVAEDKEMTSPSLWRRSYIEMSSPSQYSSDSSSSIVDFTRSATPSPEPRSHSPSTQLQQHQPHYRLAQVQSPPSHTQCQPSSPPASAFSTMTDVCSSPSRRRRTLGAARPASRAARTRKPVPQSAATVPVPSSSPPPAAAAVESRFATFFQQRRAPPHLQQGERQSVLSSSPPTTVESRFATFFEKRQAPHSQQQQQHQRGQQSGCHKTTSTIPSSTPSTSASSQVGAFARGRAVESKPYSTFGRRKATLDKVEQGGGVQAQVVGSSSKGAFFGGSSATSSSSGYSGSGSRGASRSRVGGAKRGFGVRGGGGQGEGASTCPSSSESGSERSTRSSSTAVVERAERRRVVGRRNATRHWFMPGKFLAAVGVA